MSTGKKRKALSLEVKMKILRAVEGGRKKSEVAREYDLASSTLSTILKNCDTIKKQFESPQFESSRKKCRQAAFQDVDDAVIRWFKDMRGKNLPISGPLVREKADKLGKMLGHQDFKASIGWLQRFKERHGIQQLRVCGESAGVNEEIVGRWKDETLPTLIGHYAPRDIFNADETGLFYRMTPDKTLAYKGQECHGAKLSKDRLTVMLCANMDGSEKMKPLVIGKSKNPRSLKHVRSLPVDYTSNKKAWMNSDEFTAWVRVLDLKFTAEGRKVLLLVDNCSAHPRITGLQSTELSFLPPNTTSHLQPMDQGVIMSFKTHYRRRLVKSLLQSYEAGNTPQPVSVKDAIQMIHGAWQQVTSTCIANCFEKAGFRLPETQMDIDHDEKDDEQNVADVPGPSSRPDNIWERMRSLPVQPSTTDVTSGGDASWARLSRHIDTASATFDEFAMADEDLPCTAVSTDEELVAEVRAKHPRGDEIDDGDADSEEEDVSRPPPPPSTVEAIRYVERLREFLYSRKESQYEHFLAVSHLEEHVHKCRENTLVQNKITDYFKP
ncbi:tigger transposable element-derived protein 6-like [Diadema antillarum]|uniref:tigger transposable element-derived protein 6-like n=1 Tax=Diadema antillarum TaxID=105358 RepID=UPI003A83C094